MILVDTGPLVALFDPDDAAHGRASLSLSALATLRRPMVTTVPVLGEAMHLLGAGSRRVRALGEMVERRGLGVWFLDDGSLSRCLRLMEQYRDHPMDLADASLVACAEATRTLDVLTLDRRDFSAYRARIGKAARTFRLLDALDASHA